MRSPGVNAPSAAALFLLCLLWALPSLRSDLLPGSVSQAGSSPLLSQAINLGIFAILAAATGALREANWPRGRALLQALLVGFGLFALPSFLIECAGGNLDDSTRVALFSLLPVFAVVLEPHLGSASQSPPRGDLVAALVAVTGTLLVFPVGMPRQTASVLAFCGIFVAIVSVAAANCAAVKIVRSQPLRSVFSFAALAAGSAAILLAIVSLSFERRASAITHIDAWVFSDVLALALLFWLMHRVSAVRMTTRFLIVPLVANLIALAFLRPAVQLRGWLGLLLIAAGSGWLVFAPENESEKTGLPLGIS